MTARDNVRSLMERGETAFAEGRYEAAEEAFRAALKIDGAEPRALNDLAVVLHRRGDAREAERYFLKAAIFDPEPATALINLSSLAQDDQRFAEAGRYVELAIQAGGETVQALGSMARLTATLGDGATARALWARAREITGHPPTAYRAAGRSLGGGVELLLVADALGSAALLVRGGPKALTVEDLVRIRAAGAEFGVAPEAILIQCVAPDLPSGTVEEIAAAVPVLVDALAPAEVAATGGGVVVTSAGQQPWSWPGDVTARATPITWPIRACVSPVALPVDAAGEERAALPPVERLTAGVYCLALGELLIIGVPGELPTAIQAPIGARLVHHGAVVAVPRVNGDLGLLAAGAELPESCVATGTLGDGAEQRLLESVLSGAEAVAPDLNRPLEDSES